MIYARNVLESSSNSMMRDWDFGESKLYAMPEFVRTWDDDFDSTYGYYEFSVPERWRDDFELVKAGKFSELSEEFVEHVQGCYPKLDVRDIISRAVAGDSE